MLETNEWQNSMKARVVIIKKQTAFFCIVFLSFILTGMPLFIHSLSEPAHSSIPKNKVVVIDPGHGGIDGGTSKDGVVEKEITLAISIKLRTILEERGYTVVMTREEDISLGGSENSVKNRHMKDLKTRVDIINNNNAEIFVSIHINSNPKNPKANGSIVFYSSIFDQNKILAYSIQRSLNSIIVNGEKRSIHDPQKGSFYILKYSEIPGALVEVAFISNKAEKKLLSDDGFCTSIAESMASGIGNYFNGFSEDFIK